MQVVIGKHRGRSGRICQWANDWMTVEIDGVPQREVVKPTHVQLDQDETARVRATEGTQHVGQFFAEWQLNDDGSFTARPRLRPGAQRLPGEVR